MVDHVERQAKAQEEVANQCSQLQEVRLELKNLADIVDSLSHIVDYTPQLAGQHRQGLDPKEMTVTDSGTIMSPGTPIPRKASESMRSLLLDQN